MQLMKTLDDAWNSRDWETFKKRHAENVTVYWPAVALRELAIENTLLRGKVNGA
jgi:hypothetical protein